MSVNTEPRPIYIVTGANGFLGNNIVRKLVKNPHNQVRALTSSPNRTDALQGLNCEIFTGDITKPETLNKIFDVPKDNPTYVIHCAAIVYIKSKPNPEVYNVNVNGTRNIINQTLKINAKLIDVNSVHAIPELPNNAPMSEINHFDPNEIKGEYAKSKAEAARLVLEAVKTRGLNACIVHPSGIIGPNDFKISHLTQLIIDVSTGRLKAGIKGGYNFVDVRDVVNGILEACAKGKQEKAIYYQGTM